MNKCSFLNHSIITHRGIYNNITIYENTIESIMYSLKNNLSINIDISLTKDKEIIVFNKNNITKLLKLKDDVISLNYEELEYMSHYHIPTLKEVVDNVDGKVPIILNLYDDDKIMRNNILKIIDKYNNIAIQSSDYNILKSYKKKCIVGLVINSSNLIYLNKDINVDYLSIQYDLIDKPHSNLLKQKYYLIGYTLDNREEVMKYIKIYNNLIIDNIEEVFK